MKESTKKKENAENQDLEDALLWEQAKVLLDQQTVYRKQLQEFLDKNPKTGLYRDELEELDLEQKREQHPSPQQQQVETTVMFSSFVYYIQQQLSRSPRSLLRVSLDHTSATKSKEWPEICRVLFKDHETRQTFHKAGKRMNNISPGRCFLKLQHAKESLEQSEESSLSSDMEQRVIEKQRRPPTEDLDAFRRKVQQSLEQKRHKLYAKISSLTTDLQHDTEYQQYCHLTKLWKKSGAERIWNNFMHFDLSTCRRRGFRGDSFERTRHKLIFAMIALELQLPVEELTFQTNVYWWDKNKKNGTQVGEIDLVVLWIENKKMTQAIVVAICELKNSCIDISAAFVQHQSKMVDSRYDIGPSLECLYKCPSNPPPPLYVATNLPTWTNNCDGNNNHINNNNNNNCLGVEPALVNAVCSGIRSQHLVFADTSDDICAPLVDLIEQLTTNNNPQETKTEQALAYIESLPPQQQMCPLGCGSGETPIIYSKQDKQGPSCVVTEWMCSSILFPDSCSSKY